MTKFTIKDGKLYRTGMKKVGLAEYLDWALKLPYLPVDEGLTKSGNAHITSRTICGDGLIDLDVNLSNYCGSISDMEFEIEVEELVDLKTDEIPLMIVRKPYPNEVESKYLGCMRVGNVVMWPRIGRRLVYYIDIESGETLLVWDDENKYAWEVD